MPHPFHPDDFPINDQVQFSPTKVFYLEGIVHFKTTADIYDVSSASTSVPFDDFGNSFASTASRSFQDKKEREVDPIFKVASCGEMMRTIKTLQDGSSGKGIADLNITFVSFGSSTVRFSASTGDEFCRHEIELAPVDDGRTKTGKEGKHEGFVRHSVPYFWDLEGGKPYGILYKCLNQTRVEIAKVAAYGLGKDAILALNAEELNPAVAIATCVILLNGRDAMDH